MNIFFGLTGNLAFSLANQAVAYMRQLIVGVVSGLDAVASRVTATQGEAGILNLLKRSTQIQAFIVFPAVFLINKFANSALELWVGSRLENESDLIPSIGLLMRILAIGIGARCLSEGWMQIVAGAGKVQVYARPLLWGGLLNPVLAVVAVWLAPEPYKFYMPAIVLSFVMFWSHLVAVPMAVAKEYRVPFLSLFQPMIKPGLVASGCFGIVELINVSGDPEQPQLVLFTMLYGLIYSLVCGYMIWPKNLTKAVVLRFSKT